MSTPCMSVSESNGQQYYYIGNESLLKQSPLAIFCSKEIPLSVYHVANEVFKRIIERPVVLAGGWHSPMEKRLLKNFNRDSKAKIIYFLAKGINNYNLPSQLAPLVEAGKLLVVSPFLDEPQINRRLVKERDQLIKRFCQKILFLYIQPSGNLEALFREMLVSNKEILLLEHISNSKFTNDRVKLIGSINLPQNLGV